MSEQKIQKKILDYLKAEGYYSVKTVVSNRKGVPDILACSPCGRFIAIEVKFGSNKASKLQEWNISEINKRNGIAIVAYTLDEVKACLSELKSERTTEETKSG